MGESTCLMQPFSYVSGIPNETHEVNPIHAFGHSVSFGRFTTENLAWEKWSTFSHNRYVEEAERYSRPGSVAQKKAFFEEHYRKIAAQRAAAAASLEQQANAASPRSETPSPKTFEVVVNEEEEEEEEIQEPNEEEDEATTEEEEGAFIDDFEMDRFESSKVHPVPEHFYEQEEEEVKETSREEAFIVESFETDELDSSKVHPVTEHLHKQEEEEVKEPNTKEAFIVRTDGYDSNIVIDKYESSELQVANPETEHLVLVDNSAEVELSSQMRNDADNHKEVSGIPQTQKPPLKSYSSKKEALSLMRMKKTTLSSTKSGLVNHKAPRVPSSPSKPRAPSCLRKDDNATSLHKKLATDSENMKRSSPKSPKVPSSPSKPRAPSCLRKDDNATPLHKKLATDSEDMKRSSPKSPKVPSSPSKPRAPSCLRKDDNATPLHKNLATDSEDKKRSSPKSLHKSVSFTPIRELSRFTSTVIRKIENSRVGGGSFKTSKDCLTPLRTPTMVSKNEVHKHSSTTPCSEKRRTKTPLDPSTTGTKTFGPKWRSLRTDCSKFLSACRNKARSPFSSAPFSLRTEERAASRRKKLEEKFNANEAQKVHVQGKLKEKEETEIGKFSQSLCFKARPLPHFYKERKAQKNEIQKVPVTRPESQKLGKKPSPSTVDGSTSLPPSGPPIKSSGSKHAQGKNKLTPTCSLISRSLKTTHENTHPNIQLG